MAHPDASTLREVLDLAQEFDCLDFKQEWTDLKGEARAGLAKDVLSFANSGGGLIVVGVNDDGARVGLSAAIDPSIVRQAVAAFLPTGESPATLYNFEVDGLRYQILLIDSDDELLPYESARSGAGIERGRVYVRSGTINSEASSSQMIDLVRRRDLARTLPAPSLDEMLDGLESCFRRLGIEDHGAAWRAEYDAYLRSLIAKAERNIERRLTGRN